MTMGYRDNKLLQCTALIIVAFAATNILFQRPHAHMYAKDCGHALTQSPINVKPGPKIG